MQKKSQKNILLNKVVIPKNQLLPFITNARLFLEVAKVIDTVRGTLLRKEKQFFKNSIDPFSAMFDVMWQNITLDEWFKQEKSRQNQKTLQNALGDFHQRILGSFDGWKDMGRGNVFDLKNKSKKIIAEVKNKHNTTKGNHKVAIYDDLKTQLIKKYKGYIAYYVEVIPKNKKIYDKPFTPSDNRTHKQRLKNERIRQIDGKSFYEIAAGDKEALRKIYEVLPEVIGKILRRPNQKRKDCKHFKDLFDKIY